MKESALSNVKLGVVGTGVMAEAMIAGLLHQQLLSKQQIVCSHPRSERRAELEQRYGVQTVQANSEAVVEADLVLIAVKPQFFIKVAPELREVLSESQTVISILAGATTHAISTGLAHRAVIRAMPNTPAQIDKGVTVWFATESVSDAAREQAHLMLGALGIQLEVEDESHVAMATAVSGTGPTYTFLFIEAMVDAAVRLGFSRHVARELVLETVLGTAEFAKQSGKHAAELRDMVTSPGGTSAAALYELEKGGMRTVISDAIRAAYQRTVELEAALEEKLKS
jgi:pyrroline-5-carboxylate reductase